MVPDKCSLQMNRKYFQTVSQNLNRSVEMGVKHVSSSTDAHISVLSLGTVIALFLLTIKFRLKWRLVISLQYSYKHDIIILLTFIFTCLHGYQNTPSLSTNKQRHCLLLLKTGIHAAPTHL